MIPFILNKENDPRCSEFYKKAFPEMLETEREKLRLRWITNYSRNNKNNCKIIWQITFVKRKCIVGYQD